MTDNKATREKDWHDKLYETDAKQNSDSRKYYCTFIAISRDTNSIIYKHFDKETTLYLEYGCGRGAKLMSIAPLVKRAIGIDISEVAIQQAKDEIKSNNIDNIDFYSMDATNTSFEDKYFDVISGRAILHHLDLKSSLLEIKRILKDDGVAFFLEPMDTNLLIKLYRKLTPKIRTIDEQPFRKQEINLIKSVFENAEIKYYLFLSLLAVPFRNTKFFDMILSVLFTIDKQLLHRYSPFKGLAWCCFIILKP